MSEQKIKIIAQSVEEFKSLYQEINIFPESIKSQIETVENTLSGDIRCVLKQTNKEKNVILIPKDTKRIETSEDYILIFSGHFIFEISNHLKNSLLTYIFLDTKE